MCLALTGQCNDCNNCYRFQIITVGLPRPAERAGRRFARVRMSLAVLSQNRCCDLVALLRYCCCWYCCCASCAGARPSRAETGRGGEGEAGQGGAGREGAGFSYGGRENIL